MGDILYAALVSGSDDTSQSAVLTVLRKVHAIAQMIDTFVEERMQLSASRIDLRVSMHSTGVWKQGAKFGAVVELAANLRCTKTWFHRIHF
jgi:hypothetical protein